MKYRNGPSNERILQHNPGLKEADYRDFIGKLDRSTLTVTEWEQQFIGTIVARPKDMPLSPRMKMCIDRMIKKYRDRLNW
jgi:hypothetical protein